MPDWMEMLGEATQSEPPWEAELQSGSPACGQHLGWMLGLLSLFLLLLVTICPTDSSRERLCHCVSAQ